MSRVQTPEEHFGALIAAYEDANREDRALCEPSVRVKVNQGALAVAALIRARDAEVREAARTEALAGFVEHKRTIHGLKPCDCPGASDDWREQNPHIDWSRTYEERRLVGPWEPDANPTEGEADE